MNELSKSKSARFAQGERPDNFTMRHQSSNPDAGCYNHNYKGMGTDSKAASMGNKYKPIINSNPGPGEYDNDVTKIKSSPRKANMGTGARPDNFTNKHQS